MARRAFLTVIGLMFVGVALLAMETSVAGQAGLQVAQQQRQPAPAAPLKAAEFQPPPAPPGRKPDSIVVNSSGGVVNAVLRAAFIEPFEKAYGVKVIDTSPTDFGKLKAMVESGNVEWDVTEIGGQDGLRAQAQGLLEPLDLKVIDTKDFVEGLVQPHLLPTGFYSTVLGFRTDAFPGDTHPKSWAEFWDVKKFPGPRSLRNHPVDNLEFALMADGVSPDRLYPLDVDRAFKKLDQIKPHINVWWTTGAQPAQLLVDKEVVLASGWNGRFYDVMMKGAPVAVEWNQGVLKSSWFAVPRGTKNKEYAMRFLAFMAAPQYQAEWANRLPYPGANKAGLQFVKPEVVKHLPTYTENIKKQALLKDAWWLENGAKMQERWTKWMLAQ